MLAVIALTLIQTPAQLTAPAEAPFRATDEAIIINVKLNGKTVSLLFDTGFGGEFLMSDQINLGPYTGSTSLRDFVGQFTARTVNVKDVEIGDLKRKGLNAEAVMQPVGRMSESYGTHTDGIMGLAVIKDYITEINFEKQKFIFHPKSFDITKMKPDNKRTFLVKMEPRGMNSVQLPAEINGKPVNVALDTGNAFYATTHKEVLERVGLWDPSKKPNYMSQSFVASGPVDSFYMFIRDSKIFNVPVKDAIWDIIDLPSSSVEDDGTIGYQFLKNFNIVLDYERRYVWLDNFSGKVKEEPQAETGIRLAPKLSGGYAVYHVFKGSPADEQGVKPNDVVLSIDGKSLSNVLPQNLKSLLEGKPDSICKIVISRDGIIQRLEMRRKLLVNGM